MSHKNKKPFSWSSALIFIMSGAITVLYSISMILYMGWIKIDDKKIEYFRKNYGEDMSIGLLLSLIILIFLAYKTAGEKS